MVYINRMKYLVVHQSGPFTAITVEQEGKVYINPIKCWALSDGEKVEFVNMRMDTYLKKFYVSGTFQTKALYALTYDEMCMLLTSKLGPDDESRYNMIKQAMPVTSKNHVASTIIEEAGWFGLKAIFMAIKTLLFIVLFPIIIAFFNKRK